MGNQNSIFYNDCNEGIKDLILKNVIREFSDESITGISYSSESTFKDKNVYFITLKSEMKIKFRNRLELIHFVKKLGRPFIFTGDFVCDNHIIYFIYNPEERKEE
jgi:hypothetical protein